MCIRDSSMPYEKHVSPVTLASMGLVIGALKSSIRVPFGAEAIFDGDATIALCAATEADFTPVSYTHLLPILPHIPVT